MPRESSAETLTPQRTFIDITINRAALGEAQHVFAVIQSIAGEANYPLYVPRRDIIVDEQSLNGEELSARLAVDIIEDHGSYYLVETEREGGSKVRLRVNKEGKIEPLRYKATFVEELTSS